FLAQWAWLVAQLRWKQRTTSQRLLSPGVVFASARSFGVLLRPGRHQPTEFVAAQPESLPGTRRLFPHLKPCTLPTDENPLREQSDLHPAEQRWELAAQSPACSRRFPAPHPA